MKAQGTLLCDLVQQTEGGKVNLLGVFNRFWATGPLPTELQPFFLHTVIIETVSGELKPNETLIQIQFASTPEDKDAEETELFNFEIKLPDPDPVGTIRPQDKFRNAKLYLQIVGVEVKAFGRHRMRIKADGELLDEVIIRLEERTA